MKSKYEKLIRLRTMYRANRFQRIIRFLIVIYCLKLIVIYFYIFVSNREKIKRSYFLKKIQEKTKGNRDRLELML